MWRSTSKFISRPGSYEFFAQETQRYKQALEDSEARLRAFGQTQGVADPDDERTDMALQLAAAVGQSHTTEQAIAADEQRIRSDQEQMRVTPQRSATKQDTRPLTFCFRISAAVCWPRRRSARSCC